MRRRLVRSVRRWQQRGAARFGYAVARKAVSLPVLRHVLHIYAGELLHLPLDQARVPGRIPKNFQVRANERDDLGALAKFYGSEPLVRRRLDRGDRCVMTVCQGQVGAAVWLAIGPSDFEEDWDEARYVCRFPAGVIWTYDGRGTRWGAWGALMARLPEIARQHGAVRLVTLIDCNNWQSLDAHRSLGYSTTGFVACAGGLGFARTLARPVGQRWRRPPLKIGDLQIVGRQNALAGQDLAAIG